ncbi:MAG: sensor domain-containing protein [Xanthomonadales bacterium]|nr:sensor domain-containing protein [Xanthomonadales bacterium]
MRCTTPRSICAELAEHPGLDEAAMLAKVATSYGAPDEVAEIYRVKEGEVTSRPCGHAVRARWSRNRSSRSSSASPSIRAPMRQCSTWCWRWRPASSTSPGSSPDSGLSAGFAILIIGIPFIVLFFATVRAVAGRGQDRRGDARRAHAEAALECRSGQVDLAAHRRHVHRSAQLGTLFYMLLMLPLGIVYFCIVTVGMSLALGFIAAPFLYLFGVPDGIIIGNDAHLFVSSPFRCLCFCRRRVAAVRHAACGQAIGHLHGQLAGTCAW